MRDGIIFHFLTAFFIFNLSIIPTANAGSQEVVWERVSVSYGINDSEFRTVKVDPVNSDTVYVASSSTIFKTTDAGRSWKELVSLSRTEHTINTLALDPSSPDRVYAGTRTGLYRSNNGGANWRRIFRGFRRSEDSVLSVSISQHDPTLIFIGTEAGIYRSDDHGNDWKRVQAFSSGVPVFFIEIDSADPDMVYAVTDKEFYKSSDSGRKWSKIYSARVTSKGVREVEFNKKVDIRGKEFTIEFNGEVELLHKQLITALAIDPADSSILYINTLNGVMVCRDGGNSWTALGRTGLINGNVHHLSLDNAGNLYAATDRGVVRYLKEEKGWDILYKGMTSDIIYNIDISEAKGSKRTVIWAVTGKGVYKTFLSGAY